jgi:hypothetical protein
VPELLSECDSADQGCSEAATDPGASLESRFSSEVCSAEYEARSSVWDIPAFDDAGVVSPADECKRYFETANFHPKLSGSTCSFVRSGTNTERIALAEVPIGSGFVPAKSSWLDDLALAVELVVGRAAASVSVRLVC